MFALDVFQCPRGGGRRRIVGVHTGGERLRVLLERLGLDSASPSAAPSRAPPRAQEYPHQTLAIGFPRPDGSGPLAGVCPRLRSGSGRARLLLNEGRVADGSAPV